MALLVVFWYLLKSRLNFLFLAIFIIFLLVTVFNEDFAFIELHENKIILKRLFRKSRKYDKEELTLRCAIREVSVRNGVRLEACLMVGELKEKHFYSDTGQIIYEDYFLVVVDSDKKRNIITQYFNREIELPEKVEWDKFKEYFNKKEKNLIGKKRTNKELQRMDDFYNVIEKYNNSLVKEKEAEV